jgi:hypothetical protein
MPWFIRRFVDAEAEIIYVPPDEVLAVAEREGGTPFDIRTDPPIEYGPTPDERSFDRMIAKLRPEDPAMQILGDIVARRRPEGAGYRAAAMGFRYYYDEQGQDDQAQLETQLPMFDALYAYCQQEAGKAKNGGQ